MSPVETEIQGWLGTIFLAVTAIGVLFNIRQIIVSSRIAKSSAHRAEAAALLASTHAQQAAVRAEENTVAVREVSANVEKIEVATNSMMARARELALEKAKQDAEVARAAGAREERQKTVDRT